MATKLKSALLAIAFLGLGISAGFAENIASDRANSASDRANSQFLGIDLDNGAVYYNGRNSGRYCLYRTIEVYNPYTGYVEYRRVRRCGRGMYL
jgi:hypothetical protein